jgi:Protein of unknown function (DUF3631)
MPNSLSKARSHVKTYHRIHNPAGGNGHDLAIPSDRREFEDLKPVLLKHVDELLPCLFPSGDWLPGGEFALLNPHRNDRGLGSLRVNPTTGAWADFALPNDPAARGGDLISLVAYFFDMGQLEAAARLARMVRMPLFENVELAELDISDIRRFEPIPETDISLAKYVVGQRKKPPRASGCSRPSGPGPKGSAPDYSTSLQWCYENAEGYPVLWIVRGTRPDGTKSYLQYSYRGGAWVGGGIDGQRPLYHLPELLARPDAPVLVVEGEKTSDAAAQLFPDFVATTSGGAASADKSDWSPLKDRTVTLWPDRDAAGLGYARVVAKLLRDAGAAAINLVEVPDDFPEKWDLADEVPAGADIRTLLNAARPELEIAEITTRDGDMPGEERLVEPSPQSGSCATSHDQSTNAAGAASPQAATAINDEAMFQQLALLSPIDYDRIRKDWAEKLGIRVGTLDGEVEKRRPKVEIGEDSGPGQALSLDVPEPWPDKVDGAALLQAIVNAIQKYVAVPRNEAIAVALWCILAHAFMAFSISARLVITSPEKRCGKTTLLRVIKALVPKALPAANITAAAMFRTIEAFRPSLLVDEADTFLKENEELRGIINSGHAHDGQVIRLVGDDHEPRAFSTYCPTAIAAIGDVPGTIEDRAIVIAMKRRRADERIARLRADRIGDLRELNRKIARFVSDIMPALRDSDPDVPAKLHDRAADNWRALLAVADAVGGEWPVRARAAALALSAEPEEADSLRTMLLGDIRAVFETVRTDRLKSDNLVSGLIDLGDRPWATISRGKPLDPNKLARMLKPFGVRPCTIRLSDGKTAKGYCRSNFDDAFGRYLSSAEYMGEGAVTP